MVRHRVKLVISSWNVFPTGLSVSKSPFLVTLAIQVWRSNPLR